MADRWDGCVVVATATIDLGRVLRAFRTQVYTDRIGESDDDPSAEPPAPDDVERLRSEGLVPRGHLMVAAPFPGVGLLLVSPPFFGETERLKEAPPEFAQLAAAVREALPDAPSIGWAAHERTACAQVVLADGAHDLDEPDEGDHARGQALLADLDAQAGVELTRHLTAVDLAPGRVSVAWDETDPVRLRAAEEALRASMGPAPRVPRLDVQLGDRVPRPPTTPEDLPVEERGRPPTDLAVEQAAYASNRRLVRVLAVLVVATALLVVAFVFMAARWQPR